MIVVFYDIVVHVSMTLLGFYANVDTFLCHCLVFVDVHISHLWVSMLMFMCFYAIASKHVSAHVEICS